MKKQHWYSRSRSVPATPRGLPADAIANSPGCMSMVHYLIFAPGAGCVGRPPSHDSAVGNNPSHHLDSSSPANRKKGGLEAPRNSLELEGDELRDIQIGVQVQPAFDALAMSGRRSTGSRATAPSSEAGTPRTPSLVARLMGIDGLPHDSSPSPGLKKSSNPARVAANVVKEKKKRVIPESMNRQPLRSLSCNVGAGEARSLPDTPRASASSARSASAWDVVDRPRLSLQVLKENVLDRAAQYMSMPTSPTSSSKRNNKDSKKDGHRRRDAKEHAREIVRQAKETVTNRNKSGGGKKPTSTASAGSDKENASPIVVEDKRMVFVQVPTAPASVKPTAPLSARVQVDQQQPHAPRLPPPPPRLRAKPSRPPPPPPPPDHPTPPRAAPLSPQAVKCKRPPDGCERFATRIKKPVAGAGAATIQQAAPAAPTCPAPATPVCFSTAHNHQRNHHPAVASTSSSRAPVSLEEDPEYGYLRSVLERGGLMRTTPPPSQRPFKGNSASSPVDPIVFHLLELDLPTDDSPRLGPLRHRWNRKLLFHLAQEILADLLVLDGAPTGSAATSSLHGTALLGKVWSRVKAFPAADCRVVGDIDELVATDLHASSARGLERHPAVAEEAGDVADDVAEWVLDALLRESLPCSWSWSPARAPRVVAVGPAG